MLRTVEYAVMYRKLWPLTGTAAYPAQLLEYGMPCRGPAAGGGGSSGVDE